MRIPTSGAAIGPGPQMSPRELPSTGEFIGAGLQELGKSLSQFAQKEAVRKDKILLVSNPIESIIQNKEQSSFDMYEFNADGSVNYASSLEKSENIINSSDALWEKSRIDAINEINAMPFESRETQAAVLAAVNGHFNSEDSESRRRRLVANQDKIKSDYIESLLGQGIFNEDSDIEETLVRVTDIIDSMVDPGKAQKNFAKDMTAYMSNASFSSEGALQILETFESEKLNNYAERYISRSLQTVESYLGINGSNKSTNWSVTPVDTEYLSDVEEALANMDQSNPYRFKLEAVVTSAKAQLNYNSTVITDLSSGEAFENPEAAVKYLSQQMDFTTLNTEQLGTIVQKVMGNRKGSTTLPVELADVVNNFILQSNFDKEGQDLFEFFANQYNSSNLGGINREAEERLEFYRDSQGATFEERIARAKNVENVDLTEEPYATFINSARFTDVNVGIGVVDTDIENMLEDYPAAYPEDTVDVDEITQASVNTLAMQHNVSLDLVSRLQVASAGALVGDSETLKGLATKEMLNRMTITNIPGTEVPLVFPTKFVFSDANGNKQQVTGEQARDFVFEEVVRALRKASPDLSYEELQEKAVEELKNTQFHEGISVGTMVGTNLSTGGMLNIRLEDIYRSTYDREYRLEPKELSPSSPEYLLKETQALTPETNAAFTEWKSSPATQGFEENFPLKDQLAVIMELDEYKTMDASERFQMLQEFGDRFVKASNADPYLINSKFRELFVNNFLLNLEKEAFDYSRIATGTGEFDVSEDVRRSYMILEMEKMEKGLMDMNPYSIDQNYLVNPLDDEADSIPMVKKGRFSQPGRYTASRTSQALHKAYGESILQYHEEIAGMSDTELRVLFDSLKNPILGIADLTIEEFTPVGVLQGSVRAKDLASPTIFNKAIKAKKEREAELNTDSVTTTGMYLQFKPTFSDFAALSSKTDKQIAEMLPVINTEFSDALSSATEDPNLPSDTVRLAIIGELSDSKSLQSMLAAMTEKRFNKFLNVYLKTRTKKEEENE